MSISEFKIKIRSLKSQFKIKIENSKLKFAMKNQNAIFRMESEILNQNEKFKIEIRNLYFIQPFILLSKQFRACCDIIDSLNNGKKQLIEQFKQIGSSSMNPH